MVVQQRAQRLTQGRLTGRARSPQSGVGLAGVESALQEQSLFTRQSVGLVGSGQTQTVFGVQGVVAIGLHRQQSAALVGQVGQQSSFAQEHQLKSTQHPRRGALPAGEQLHRTAVVIEQTRMGVVSREQTQEQFVEVAAREQSIANGHHVPALPLGGLQGADLGITTPSQEQRLQGQQHWSKL